MSNDTVVELVESRLVNSGLSPEAKRLALASVLGKGVLAKAIASASEPVTTKAGANPTTQVRGLWIRSITVEGFRGIGPAATLRLEPGPELTLVVGRNGSGKSSFAEAAEAALTGTNERLTNKTVDWRKQWRNIHGGEEPTVIIELDIEGESRTLTLRRSWIGNDIGESTVQASWEDGEHQDLTDLGWNDALERFRPLLSYDDLGKISGRPSTQFDHLIAVLGIEALTEAQEHLTEARSQFDTQLSAPKERLQPLLRSLKAATDERANATLRALTSMPPNLLEIRKPLTDAPDVDSGTTRAALTKLTTLPIPEKDDVVARVRDLREATSAMGRVKGSNAEEAANLADLLEAALTHHTVHGDGTCPVCQTGTLDRQWREKTTAEIARLRGLAADVTSAKGALRSALNRAHQLVQQPPTELTSASKDVDTAKVATAWSKWAELAAESDASILAAQLESRFTPLVGSVKAVRAAAAARLRQVEDAWRPVAAQIEAWLEAHEGAEKARPTYESVATALEWIKNEAERVRDLRLAPFREQSARIWADLRQDSNVDLGEIAFAGSGRTRRKLQIPVRIDGVVGGVPMLSNGELHALGLALFLPRSSAPDSPFRFIIIDDPVQAMDPAKVEGLAKVLHAVAADRQVVVFTHDDRLADALRRLMLPTTILEVVRRHGSVVEIVPNLDPVARYLTDARQIARTGNLPDDLAAIAAVGSCRDAIEVACQRVARRRLRATGSTISEVDNLLLRAQTTNQRVAIALLGDSSATSQVMLTLNRLAGARWAGDVLRDVREGIHQQRNELARIIADSERLCTLILDAAPS